MGRMESHPCFLLPHRAPHRVGFRTTSPAHGVNVLQSNGMQTRDSEAIFPTLWELQKINFILNMLTGRST
jgi:hypothetical protein